MIHGTQTSTHKLTAKVATISSLHFKRRSVKSILQQILTLNGLLSKAAKKTEQNQRINLHSVRSDIPTSDFENVDYKFNLAKLKLGEAISKNNYEIYVQAVRLFNEIAYAAAARVYYVGLLEFASIPLLSHSQVLKEMINHKNTFIDRSLLGDYQFFKYIKYVPSHVRDKYIECYLEKIGFLDQNVINLHRPRMKEEVGRG